MTDGTQTAAGGAPAPNATTGTSTGGTQDTRFYAGIEDQDVRGWLDKKNFPDLTTMAKSHLEAERLIGQKRLPVPKDESDAAAYGEIYKALGIPDTEAGYTLDPKETGLEGKPLEVFKKAFFDNKVPPKAAQNIIKAYNEFSSSLLAEEQQVKLQQGQQEVEDLKKEWGANFDKNVHLGKQAARALGVDEKVMDKLEESLGTKAFLGLFTKVGGMLREDSLVTTEGGSNSFGMPKDQAIYELNALKQDAGFRTKLLANDAESVRKWKALNAAAAQ
jgi:hypothetical protein